MNGSAIDQLTETWRGNRQNRGSSPLGLDSDREFHLSREIRRINKDTFFTNLQCSFVVVNFEQLSNLNNFMSIEFLLLRNKLQRVSVQMRITLFADMDRGTLI